MADKETRTICIITLENSAVCFGWDKHYGKSPTEPLQLSSTINCDYQEYWKSRQKKCLGISTFTSKYYSHGNNERCLHSSDNSYSESKSEVKFVTRWLVKTLQNAPVLFCNFKQSCLLLVDLILCIISAEYWCTSGHETDPGILIKGTILRWVEVCSVVDHASKL